MKRYISAILLLYIIFLNLSAQDRNKPLPASSKRGSAMNGNPSEQKVDTAKIKEPSIYGWKLSPRFGERIFVPKDTMVNDFHQTSLVDGQAVAMGYLGNIGSPAMSKIFFDRQPASRFIFLDGLYLSRKGPQDHLFLNTKVPYSNIHYLSGGGGESAENLLNAEISSNFGKKVNVGFNFDYLYARGFYTSLYNKQINYDLQGSYIGDKYKMNAFVANNNFHFSENGGIKDLRYITSPRADGLEGFTGNSLEIPVRIEGMWNRLRGRHIYVTNRYDLGNDMEEYAVNDTTMAMRKKENYIPLASAIFTTHYTDQRRTVTSHDDSLDDFYRPFYNDENKDGPKTDSPKYGLELSDFMSYYSFKNTLALAMNEGFRSWTKFGLTAFIESDIRRFAIPGIFPGILTRGKEDVLLLGGVLSNEKGKYLRYKATAEKDLINNDYRLEGELTTMVKFKDKELSVKARAYIKSIMPSFFENNFSSKYWTWKRDFSNTQRAFLGGEINLPELSFSKTRISGGVENIQNYIYYGTDRMATQATGNVQILSLRLDQDLSYGIFHWNNQIVYQVTSDDEVIPLPTLSAYTNIFLMTKIAKVLTLQMGVDAHIHTQYYMPGYEPLTMQFYNQREDKLGAFPIATGYINLHLKNTRFFIMMYNLAEGMGNSQSFSLHRYPVNPRILKLGLSWKFNN